MQRSIASFDKSRLMGSRRLMALGLLVSMFVLGATVPASASIQFSLGDFNSALSPYPAPYGTVTVTAAANSNTAVITLTALSQGSFSYLFGDGNSFALNVNDFGSIVGGVSNIAYTQPTMINGMTPEAPSYALDTGGQNVSAFGNFNFVLDQVGGQAALAAVSSLTFTITKASGTWATESQVLTPNNKGYSTAGHVFVYDNNYNQVAGNITGFAGDGDGGNITEIPEPASLATWGLLGLVGVGGVIRRRFARKA